MRLRLTYQMIFVFLSILLIKDGVCQALNLQAYPTGITAIDAQTKCGTAGLENDPLLLTQVSQLHGQEFWTGQGIFIQLTPWIEIIGCFLLNNTPSTVNTTKSVGLCQKECSTEYFGYNENGSCSCFEKIEIRLNETESLLSCNNSNSKNVLVYKIYNGKREINEAVNGLCSTLICTPPYVEVLAAAPCKGTSSIKGVCEDGQPSTTLRSIWNLQWNQALTNCWKQSKLLLNSSVCQYPIKNLRATAWTNVFREEIEIQRIIDNDKERPTFCLSANIFKSDKEEYGLNWHRKNCSTTLDWFVCKNDSTRMRNNTNKETASSHGAVIGGSIGAVIVLLIVVSVVMCKIRRIGLFKSSKSANTTTVVFTLGLQTQQQFNESNGLVYQTKEKKNERNDAYAQVQSVKHMDDIYTESLNGEYDHLHNIGGRKLNGSENTYNSNAGVRNQNDPTYDTATSSTGVDMDTTYDHSFSKMKDYSEYDVSDSSIQIARTNYDAYDQAC
ncbi:uncharacterized protein LOC143054424 [Mytilus galloprovincialis]|uniref:uncharacterized protein LOC143054424 n=1 Tax=Mytilus galloprovincialis TaxID=29158 RepID=UPI003F7C0F43